MSFSLKFNLEISGTAEPPGNRGPYKKTLTYTNQRASWLRFSSRTTVSADSFPSWNARLFCLTA